MENKHSKYDIDWKKYLSEERFRPSNKASDGENNSDHRSPFESDFGRVVFSSPIRRMHDKTQVIPLTSGDNIHTRLTHSLEVMNTAKSLAIDLCRDKDFIEEYGEMEALILEQKISAILMTAGLVHDIGNPPFGHFGETVIKEYFKDYFKRNDLFKTDKRDDFCEFDGNAQGLRILTHLTYVGDLNGMNLTKATLASYMKYPNAGKIDKSYIGTKKHGVFHTEKKILEDVAVACGMKKGEKIIRHPLSFLVEAADSICYLAMDIEDGYNLKWYDNKILTASLDRELNSLIKENKKKQLLPADRYKNDDGSYSFLKIIGSNLSDQAKWKEINESDWIVKFRTGLIRYLVSLAINNFKKNAAEIAQGAYSRELIEDNSLFITEALQKFTRRHILSQRDIQKAELTGHKVISGLLDILTHYVCHPDESFRDKVKNVISKSILKVSIHEENYDKIPNGYMRTTAEDLFNVDLNILGEYQKLRLVVDFVSGMTDKFAVSLYQELLGIKI
ncbi:MAG: dNTP triphosphohydrolase [Bacteroidales bacterium]|nr:dNTP triphosphohydrolase [Bacteroidales bacterium]